MKSSDNYFYTDLTNESIYARVFSFLKDNARVIVFIFLTLSGITYYILTTVTFPVEKQLNSDTSAQAAVQEEFNQKENSTYIFVDVSGAVENPGIYQLEPDARVADALKQSGKILNTASAHWVSKKINLANKLKDGDKIYIPFEFDLDSGEKEFTILVEDPLDISTTEKASSETNQTTTKEPIADSDDPMESGQTTTQEGKSSLVNVNNASSAELEELPGIGEAYAKRIIDNRPLTDFADLAVKTKIPKNTLAKIQDLIVFN